MESDKKQEAAAKLLIRSYLDKVSDERLRIYLGRVKHYVLPFVVATVAIAMTMFESPHAYSLAKFASPIFLILIWAAYGLAEAGEIKIPTKKEKNISKKFLAFFYSTLVALLAAFGHWWLAWCWLFIWIAARLTHRLYDERLEEKGKDHSELHVGKD